MARVGLGFGSRVRVRVNPCAQRDTEMHIELMIYGNAVAQTEEVLPFNDIGLTRRQRIRVRIKRMKTAGEG